MASAPGKWELNAAAHETQENAPKSKKIQQDIMLEKLARWKAERAQKKKSADDERRSKGVTNPTNRQPLKEAKQLAHATEKQEPPTEKSLNGKERSKRRPSDASVQKSSVQELSMREKLELWRAQQQQSEKKKKNPSSQLQSTSSMKNAMPFRHLAHVTPQSKITPARAYSSGKCREDGAGPTVGVTPKKHLFKTPTSVKHKARPSDKLDTRRPKMQSTEAVKDSTLSLDWCQKSTHQASTADSHHTTNTDPKGDHLPVKRCSSTPGEQSSKRRAVSFVGAMTPVRCSPRLQKLRESAGGLLSGQSQAAEPATPKQPWQDKKLDMQQRLEHWLAQKGKTPSRYSHLLSFKRTPADLIRRQAAASRRVTPAKTKSRVWQLDSEPSASLESDSGSDEDELMAALNKTMDECFLLLQTGCPAGHVSEWLDNLVGKVPAMHQCAKYWLCRITIAEGEGQDANEIINIYEEAVRGGAEPIQDIKDSLQQYVAKLMEPTPSPQAVSDASPSRPTLVPSPRQALTPKSRKDRTAMEQLLRSSVLKYCLTESTPYFDRIRAAVGEQVPAMTPGLTLVTPVRRSTRLEGRRSCLPLNLQDHDVCLASLDEMPSPQEFVLRTNPALEGEFLEQQDERAWHWQILQDKGPIRILDTKLPLVG